MFTVIDCLNDCLFDCLFAIDCLFDCLFYVSFVTLTFLKLIFQRFRKSVFKPFSGILRKFGKKKKAVKKPPLMATYNNFDTVAKGVQGVCKRTQNLHTPFCLNAHPLITPQKLPALSAAILSHPQYHHLPRDRSA